MKQGMFLFSAAITAAALLFSGCTNEPEPEPVDGAATRAPELNEALVRVNIEVEEWQMIDILFEEDNGGPYTGASIEFLTISIGPYDLEYVPGEGVEAVFAHEGGYAQMYLPPGDYFMRLWMSPYMGPGATHMYIPFTLPKQGGEFTIGYYTDWGYPQPTLHISPFLPFPPR